MKNNVKNYVILACLSASFVAGTAAVTSAAVNAKAEETLVSSELTMNVGASLYLEEVSGLKFSYTVKNYSEETHGDNNYGMLIVPYDYLAKAGITDLTLATNDYVPTLQAAAGDKTIAKEPIVVDSLQPTAAGLVEYSIGDLYENNYARAFFGIGFEATETADGAYEYEYAVQNDNVRSVFEVANLALNKLHYGEWTEEDIKEKELLESKEADVLNPFLMKGFEFVYGTTAPQVSLPVTYVGGDIAPTITTEQTKPIDLGVHWYYDSASLTRGKAQPVTVKLANAITVENVSANVLKDADEYRVYDNLTAEGKKDTNFFAEVDAPVVEGTYTAQMTGGYYKATDKKSGANITGYLAFKNPDSEDAKYTLEAGKGYSLDFYFKGNNMPNVEFFASEINSTIWKAYNSGRKGYLVTNGLGTDYLYTRYTALAEVGLSTVYPSSPDKTLWDTWKTIDENCIFSNSNHKYNGVSNYVPTFFQYGVTAYDGFTNAATKDGKNDKASFAFAAVDDANGKTYTWAYASSGITKQSVNRSAFSMESLMKDESKEWHYVVGMYLDASNNVKVESYLYEITSEGETLTDSYTETVETTTEVRSGYIVAHAALKGIKLGGTTGEYIPTQLAYTMPKQITK